MTVCAKSVDVEELLYVGNKKAKQLRDRRKELIDYLFEGGGMPAWVGCPQWRSCERVCELIDEHDLCMDGVEAELNAAHVYADDVGSLDGFFDCSSSDEIRSLALYSDDWIDEDGVVYTTLIDREYGQFLRDLVDDWSDSLHELLFAMKCDIDAFYSAKSAWLAGHLEPVGFHDFDGFQCILFRGERFSFHAPADDVELDVDDFEFLGPLEQVGSEIRIESKYSELDLNEIVSVVRQSL